MPKVHIREKLEKVNVISNDGKLIEIDEFTLAKWNKIYSDWWNMQLEMDKLANG